MKSYFDARLNNQGQGFDDSTKRQVDFSSLIKTATLDVADNTSKYDDRGIIYKLPDKVLFILNEKIQVTEEERISDGKGDTEPVSSTVKNLVVVPINYKEYDREMSKPYAQPLKKQAWRLFQNIEQGYDIYSELILN